MLPALAMSKSHPTSSLVVLGLGLSLLGSRARGAAPSFEAFGAFFPACMLCASAGIAGATAARAAMVRAAAAAILPFQLLLCTAIGTIVAILVWLLFFG